MSAHGFGLTKLGVLALTALALAILLLVEHEARGPLDDSDPARQRTGLLLEATTAEPAPGLAGVRWEDAVTVVLFTGDHRPGPLCDAARHDDAALVVVGAGCSGAIVSRPQDVAGLAKRFGLRPTASGRLPIGYALVDRQGRIRYATLDPGLPHHPLELTTMLEALL